MTWQPTWQAGTAYSLMAVVIPTTFSGYTWRATTAGTSAGSEPSWPADPSLTPTVSDGTVVWTVGTGFRQAITSNIVALVQGFSTANATIIRSVRKTRPRSFTTADLPCFYVGDLDETLTHNQGLRTRTVSGFSCFLVDFLGEQIESADRMDFVVDALTDLFTLNYHAVSGRSIFEQTETRDTEITDGPTIFPAVEFVFGATSVMEGRT